ncbi:MAG: hypothetical protein NTX53_09225 [candidate division WOR-3 bacterium]|nr:hypothetical protein [candidate division WOR-3 bacterium]
MAGSEPDDFAEELFVDLTEHSQQGVEESKMASPLVELGAELFFLVVAGEEDLAVLVEAVDKVKNRCGGRRTHAARE